MYVGGTWSESLLLNNPVPWPRMGLVDQPALRQVLGMHFPALAGQSLRSKSTASRIARKEPGKQASKLQELEVSQENRGTDEHMVDQLKRWQTDQHS